MKHLLFDSYLAVIKNSVASRLFQNVYCSERGKKIDVANKGELSCAFHVSAILKIFDLISAPHATVRGTIKDMEADDWRKIKKPKKGAIIHWEKNHNGHEHLGFYIGNHKAISNSTAKRAPIVHHWTYKNQRKIIAVYWNKRLEHFQ